MTLSEYEQLKQQIVFNVGKSENYNKLLDKLKEFYKDDIDSERRFEQITKTGLLLNILEKREVLTEDDVGPLKEIARRLNNNDLLKKISDYEVNHRPRAYINHYALENTSTPSVKESKENKFTIHPIGVMSKEKLNRITDTLIKEIGVFWRDLGRNLKIREGQIDEIDSKFDNTIDKALELFNLYNAKSDPQRWFFVLCDALERSRRKDLSKLLQEIITMNI